MARSHSSDTRIDASVPTAWRSAARGQKPDAHAAYLAALDREEHAAAVLQHRLRPGR